MAYNILFKKGLYSDFKTKVLNGTADEGTLYFTEDEGGLYLGVKGENNSVTARRIQGVVQQFATLTDFQNTVAPPYATDVIYYIADRSALIQWIPESGSGDNKVDAHWKVLNATAAEMAAEVAAREALGGRVTTVEGTVAGHVTAISGINESIDGINDSIDNINTNITNIVKQDGAIDTKVAASATALTEVINTKLNTSTYNDFVASYETYKTAMSNAHTTMNEAIGANASAIGDHADEIQDIKDTLSALTGAEGAEGTIAEMIATAVAGEAALREEADGELSDNISGVSTDLGNYKVTVSNTYATKDELTTHANSAAATYATKQELTTHGNTAAATYATKQELNNVSEVADRADAQASTNASAITNLTNNVTTNYATKEELTQHANNAVQTYETIANVTKIKEDLEKAISDEEARAEEAESGLQTSINGLDDRLEVVETWFNAAADSDETIDNLTELLAYIEEHKGEAFDMAGDIQANADAIEVLEGYVGVPASGAGENAVAATGLHLAVDTVANNLAVEITNRTDAVTNAITECKSYTDTALTWGSFSS